MRTELLRPKLAGIILQRYGEQTLPTATLIIPTPKQLDDYERHQGLTSLWISLARNPHLIFIDTEDFKHLQYAWIKDREPETLKVVMSSGSQSVPKRLLRDRYTQRVEALEVAIKYSSHRSTPPYKTELKPLW